MNIVLKTKLYLQFYNTLLLLLAAMWLPAQDIHFSQYYNSPLTTNPALTGVSGGDIRFSGLYRSQWNSANSPFRTVQAMADTKFYTMAHTKWWWSGGINVFYDKAGDGNLENTNVQLSGSFTRMLDRQNFMTIGVSAGFGQRNFDFGNYTFDNQWSGSVFNPDRATNENFDDTNIIYPDFGVGFNWRGQGNKFAGKERTKIDLGAGAFHLNRPDQSFLSTEKSRLPIRMSIYFMPTFQMNQNGDLVGHATYQLQGEYREALAGVGYRYFLSTKKSKEMAVQLGFSYRFNAIGDAFIPAAEFHYRELMVGLSWDINVSDFSAATNRNGGPEIAVRYIIKKVYPLRAFKACPLI
ncbi:MAG: PorP/SprF family type IX secretion system membrane protein [Bacteroidota bacterium]